MLDTTRYPKLYTEAIDNTLSTTPIETQRTILANRAQTYALYGDIHDALRDINSALSSRFTNQESAKNMTLKCYYRRAKLLCTMARYEESRADYAEFMRYMGELGVELSQDEVQLKEAIEHGATATEGSKRRQKDELMRAVDVHLTSNSLENYLTNLSQARGLILRAPYRKTFPSPPPDMLGDPGPDFDEEEVTLRFNTSDNKPNYSLSDPNLTSISIPIFIRAPYFKPNSTITTPFSTHFDTPMSENTVVATFLENLFTSTVLFGYSGDKDGMQSAMQHDEPQSVVLVVTSQGRILVIPRMTTFKKIIDGARWPRPQGTPDDITFQDLRKAPRAKDGKIDGIELGMGWFMEIYVIPKEDLTEL